MPAAVHALRVGQSLHSVPVVVVADILPILRLYFLFPLKTLHLHDVVRRITRLQRYNTVLHKIRNAFVLRLEGGATNSEAVILRAQENKRRKHHITSYPFSSLRSWRLP